MTIENISSAPISEKAKNESWINFENASTCSISECVYRGEGNANIVIAIPQERTVIRFRKSKPGKKAAKRDSAEDDDDDDDDGGKSRVTLQVEFLEKVVSHFLGPFIRIPKILRYNQKDIRELSESIRHQRPEHRRNKEIVEGYATKYPDYTSLPPRLGDCNLNLNKSTFCVEIKPKQGYICKLDEGLRKCPFCVTQYYKVQKGRILSRSKYCPFDLFSGDAHRMKKALINLVESPQNNFKIFQDGLLVYDENSNPSDFKYTLNRWFSSVSSTNADDFENHIERFCNLICASLLRPFTQKSTISQESNYFHANHNFQRVPSRIGASLLMKAKEILYFTGEECDFTKEYLPEDCVLERILRIQRLPYHSADYVYWLYSENIDIFHDDAIYSNLLRRRMNEEEICNNVSTTCKYCFVNPEDTNNCISKTESNNSDTKIRSSIDDIRILQNYLLFTMARDCSILMSFHEYDPLVNAKVPPEHLIKLTEDESFIVNIGISDLDPKSVDCIEKHLKRDIDALNAVIDILQKELSLNSGEFS